MTEMPPRLTHYLEWWLLKGILPLMQRGDMTTACSVTRSIARFARTILKREWQWARQNIRLVYGPQLSEEEVARLATLAFENVFISHLEGIRIKDVEVRSVGVEAMWQAMELGRGMVMCSIHLGSWEPMLKHMAELGFPLTVVYRHASNPLTEKLFMSMRADYGVKWARRSDVRTIVTTMRQQETVGLMMDINTVQGGLPVPFLGAPALCPPGAAKLARQFQVPLALGVCVREAPGKAALHVIDVIAPPSRLGGDEVLLDLTSKINALFAPWVHDYAEQYNWLHGRWKTRQDGTNRTPEQLTAELWPQRQEPFAEITPRIRKILAGETL
ncbi:MAG: lysophospholipid acyltransferase family protein [Magnetococcales bacterium]|nr:lysophospholipid acyltransferase family protein [Magnetococcales bacterium]NGZ28180.1 lysophospholipid acyltransferase family protein [Magnetococcales bacterium]